MSDFGARYFKQRRTESISMKDEILNLIREYWAAEENEGCVASHAIAKKICNKTETILGRFGAQDE